MLCPLTSSLVCENKRALTYSSGHVTKEKKKNEQILNSHVEQGDPA